MQNDLVIFGAGGFGRELHQIVEDLNENKKVWNFIGFLDGDTQIIGKEVHDYPILGNTEWLEKHPQTSVVVSIGKPAIRKKIVQQITKMGHSRFARLIHPTAWIGNRVEIGMGTVILAGALISTDIQVGCHAIINRNCTIGHDVFIDDFVTIAPSANITGSTHVGEGCDLGSACTFVNGASIGKWSVVGAGAVVPKDLPPNITAVGVPAKAIKERPDGWHEKI